MGNRTARWASTGGTTQVEPPEAKKDAGFVEKKPEAAQYANWALARALAGANLDRDENALLRMPLRSSLAIERGLGSATFARSTTGTYIDRYGVRQTAAIDEPRFEAEGYLAEGAGENIALHSADLSNGAWAKTDCNGVKDATGRDGVGSSASTLTATGATATCLQTVTIASAERTYSVTIKRKTGSGTIEITTDGGSTWTDITSSLSTTAWVHFQITQTLANPEFGIRITTSGDALEVDENQLEELPFASSYIPTTTTAVTRTADSLQVTIEGNIGLQADPGTVICDVDILGKDIGGSNQYAWRIEGETNRFVVASNAGAGGSVTAQWGAAQLGNRGPLTDRQVQRLGLVHEGDGDYTLWIDGVKDGTISGTDVSDSLGTAMWLGSSSGSALFLFGHISNLRIYDRALSDEEMAVA